MWQKKKKKENGVKTRKFLLKLVKIFFYCNLKIKYVIKNHGHDTDMRLTDTNMRLFLKSFKKYDTI